MALNFAFSEEQEMLRETARRFLDDKAGSTVTRALMETDSGFDDALWLEIANQGWQAMAIPEEFGGAGFSFMEVAILMEEMGRSLFPSPYLSSIVLGADLVMTAASDDQKKEMLPGVASGETRLAVAQLEPGGGWDADGINMTFESDGEDLILDGTKSFVIDGHTADSVLVIGRQPGTIGDEGISLVMVPGDAPGLSRHRVETMDQTRKQAELEFHGVRVPASWVLGDAGWPALAETLRRAAAALAFEQVGGAQRCLEMSTEYSKVRMQFGRPIGSFQAIKHKCADMLVAVESAKSAAYYAGWTASVGDEDAAVAACIAKSYCSEAYCQAAGDTIQIHGGIGFTWEHDAHLYFKRAKTDELLFGTPSLHRSHLAEMVGV